MQPIVDRALAKNPTLRYGDPLDLAKDLEELVRWMPPGSHAMGGRSQQSRPNVQQQNGAGYRHNGTGDRPPTGPRQIVAQPSVNGNGVHSNVGVRPPTGPQGAPRPYVSQPYEVGPQPRQARELIMPPAKSKRGRFVLPVVALVLLALGGAAMVVASGVFGKGSKPARSLSIREPPAP